MKFPLLSLLGLAGSALSSSSAAAAAEPPTAAILFTIPASHAVPNPNALAAATRATLSARGGPSLSAPLTASNGFVFPRVPPGSYLLDVHSGSHAFAPLRVDVAPAGAGVGAASAGRKQEPRQLAVSAWETFRGNDWGNKGEAARRAEDGGGAFEVRCLGRKEYYMERSSFSVLSILKNPMILLAMVSMGIFLGMPYLLENMDPEVRAEFESRQKSNPMSAVLGGGGQPGGGFDMAAFLAGSNNNGPKREDAGTPPPQPSAGNGGGKKNQRR